MDARYKIESETLQPFRPNGQNGIGGKTICCEENENR